MAKAEYRFIKGPRHQDSRMVAIISIASALAREKEDTGGGISTPICDMTPDLAAKRATCAALPLFSRGLRG
ncbi:MAG: hypothetical protein ACI8R4_004124 [Paracoccaceae bacterium]|jgi:hypothetical protein